MPEYAYSSKKVIEHHTVNPALKRALGVSVIGPFHHAGMNCEAVEVTFETLILNTKTFATWKPVDEAAGEVEKMTQQIIEHIDEIVVELTTHRHRLQYELARLDPKGFTERLCASIPAEAG